MMRNDSSLLMSEIVREFATFLSTKDCYNITKTKQQKVSIECGLRRNLFVWFLNCFLV
jgi:hypothetical protein